MAFKSFEGLFWPLFMATGGWCGLGPLLFRKKAYGLEVCSTFCCDIWFKSMAFCFYLSMSLFSVSLCLNHLLMLQSISRLILLFHFPSVLWGSGFTKRSKLFPFLSFDLSLYCSIILCTLRFYGDQHTRRLGLDGVENEKEKEKKKKRRGIFFVWFSLKMIL